MQPRHTPRQPSLQGRRTRLALFTSLSLLASAGASLAQAQGIISETTNPYLAASPWPITHHDSGASDSSASPGPVTASQIGSPQFAGTNLINITLAQSPLYPDGERVFWGSNMVDVYKVALVQGQLKQVARLKKPGNLLSNLSTPTSGAYTLVDANNVFYTVRGRTLLAYGDAESGVRTSPIALLRQYTLPESAVSSDDQIVGLNLTFDGRLAFVTKMGVVGVLQRDFTQLQSVTLGDGTEQVSNSLATDARGGIYVVTSQAMYRVQWSGGKLSLDPATGAWRSTYITTSTAGGGRLGAGSGSTPTVMGTENERLIVITDGADVANLVLFWADAIPSDWQALDAQTDRRVAGRLPVNFGDPNRTATQSEQSVVVSGYGAVVVSNDYRHTEALSGSTGNDLLDQASNALIVALSGTTAVQPWGVQKFSWNTSTHTLSSDWARLDVSCPNAIPTVSQASSRFYCVGAHAGKWTIESLDWTTGGAHFRKYLGALPRFNSFYASTQLTGDGGLIYGSVDGVVYLPFQP